MTVHLWEVSKGETN